MRELIDAAVQSAARSGIQAAVVLIGGDNMRVQTPAAALASQGAGVEVQQQVAALQDNLSQIAQQRDSALRQNEQLSQQCREAQARIAQLETMPPPPPADAPNVSQPTDLVDYDSMGVETLNLPEKVVAACTKNDVKTIGALRGFFAKLGAHKINQKDRITTAEALMDLIPSHGGHTAQVAPPHNSSTVTDVPVGHVDRLWKERLGVARFKEGKSSTLTEKLLEAAAAIRASIPTFPGDDEADFWKKAIAAVVNTEGEAREAGINLLGDYVGQKIVQEITSSQVAAMLYSLGFDPKLHRALDSALESAGLVHLVETVPATPVPAPAA